MAYEPGSTEPKSRRGWWIAGGVIGLLVLCCGVIVVGGIGLYAYTAPRVEGTLSAMTLQPGQYELPAAQVTELAPNLPPALEPTAPLPSATNFTNNEGRSEAPQATWDEQGNLHVVWLDSSLRPDGSNMDVFHRTLQTGGQWSDVENLSEGFDSLFGQGLLLITSPGGRFCAVWQGTKGAGMPAYYSRCWAGGQWSEAEKIDVGDEFVVSIAPALAPDGSLQAAYNSTGTWHFRKATIIPETISANYVWLTIDSAGGYHVLWLEYDEGGESLQYSFSSDGQSWEAPTALTVLEDAPMSSNRPIRLMGDVQGNMHLAWAGQEGLFYRRWTSTSKWEPTQKILGHDTMFGSSVDLAIDAQGLPHILFPVIAFGPPGLGVVQQQADGRWTDPSVVATAGGGSESIGPDGFVLAVGRDGLSHFIWQVQQFSSGPGTADLYYATLPGN